MNPFSKVTSVGFIGLGAMGLPMAGWLRKRGWPLQVHARRDEPAHRLVSAGAVRAPSPRAVGSASSLVLTCLSDDDAVEQVLFGPDGVEHGIAPGSVVVDTSTIGAHSARRFAKRLEGRGIAFLDAPVSGGQKGAEAGNLACMVGGRETVVDAVREVLGAFCRTVTHVGDAGAGQIVNACNQVAAACALLGVADAIALARSQGLGPEVMRQVLLTGTARSFVLEKDGQRIIDEDFEPGFRARLMRKDLRLALETARGRVELVGASLAESLLDELCEAGGAEMDWSAVGRLAQRKA
jgi:2-hydroxy-3-oxopropionate reductase